MTVDLPALPLSFNDEAHFTKLNEVYEALSTAVKQRSRIQFAELLRWQCLCGELNELFLNRSAAKLDRTGNFEANREYHDVDLPSDPSQKRLSEMENCFIILVEE
jgi:hypothetical protein